LKTYKKDSKTTRNEKEKGLPKVKQTQWEEKMKEDKPIIEKVNEKKSAIQNQREEKRNKDRELLQEYVEQCKRSQEKQQLEEIITEKLILKSIS
jgi:hypothetical protein